MAILKPGCPRCFRPREEAKTQPLANLKICGGCAMDVQGILGFLEFQGWQIQRRLERPETPAIDEEPPDPPIDPTKPQDVVESPETMLDTPQPLKPRRAKP